MATTSPDMVYLGWSRLHRPRANLIQTLHTVAAFNGLGIETALFLPPWKRRVDHRQLLQDMGVSPDLDLRASRLLHRRWQGIPFVWWHRGWLRGRLVYTRVPVLSVSLSRAGISHHLEIHDMDRLARQGLLAPVIAAHQQGVLDRLFPISRAAAEALIGQGAVATRVHVAPSGVDLSAFENVPPLELAALARPRLGYIGRISRARGLGVLEFLAGQGYQVRLTGPLADTPPAGVTIHPPVAHGRVAACYAETHLVLMPYQPELDHALSISPLKLFEALAAGRPVVVSDLPPIREIVQDGRTALLVDPQDPAAWQAAVDRLRGDPELARRLVENGRALARRYGWRQRAEGILVAIDSPSDHRSGCG